MLDRPCDEDVERLNRIAQRIPRYASLMKILMWNHGREKQSLTFWTEFRESNYMRIMKLFEADWCFVNDFTREWGVNDSIQQLWNQLEAMAAVIGRFAEQHDTQVSLEGVEDMAGVIPAHVFVPAEIVLN